MGFSYTGDFSDGLANNGNQVIQIYHLASAQTVQFKAFISSYTDSFVSEWNEESAFGRMDPIAIFNRTTRKISLGWDVPSYNIEESILNMNNASLLLQMLYPSYISPETDYASATNIINTSPLVRLKFMNLITKDADSEDALNGLLGKFDGFTFSPNLESGFFQTSSIQDGQNGTKKNITYNNYPKVLSFQANFTVLHEKDLGWKDNQFRDKKFPYYSPEPVKKDHEISLEQRNLEEYSKRITNEARQSKEAEEERISQAKATEILSRKNKLLKRKK
jgi:hypothetical protein